MCYGKPITTLDDNSEHTAATTIAFTNSSVCAWKLRSISEYFFNKKIQVTIKTVSNVNCHLSNGLSISTSTNYVSCQAGQVYTFDAN